MVPKSAISAVDFRLANAKLPQKPEICSALGTGTMKDVNERPSMVTPFWYPNVSFLIELMRECRRFETVSGDV